MWRYNLATQSFQGNLNTWDYKKKEKEGRKEEK